MPKLLAVLILAFSGLFLASCAVQPMVGSQVVYNDIPVDRDEPELYFNTRLQLATYPRVIFYPFVVRQKMDASQYVGRDISRIVAQVWMKDQVFPEIRYEDAPTLDERRWTCLGMCKEAQLAVTGEVLYYLDGGSSSNTSVALRVTVRATGTGEPILVMEHAGRLEAGYTRDYMVALAKNRLPENPPYAVTYALAKDMGHYLKQWGSTSQDIRRRPLSSYLFP